MDKLRRIFHKLPFPKNFFLRIIVGLIYFSIAVYFLPFFIGFLIAYYILNNAQGTAFKYGLVALTILGSFGVRTAWMAGLSSDTPTTTANIQTSIVDEKSDVPTATPNISITETPEITVTLTPAPTATTAPTAVPTKKVNTPTPTKKIVYSTSTPKLIKPTSAPLPFTGGGSTGGDKDCKDFATHASAQAFFIENGGPASDPHGLDGNDNDGLACESLP